MADITLVTLNMLTHSKYHLPLGCLTLTSCLRQAGFEVEFRDYSSQFVKNDFFNLNNLANYFAKNSADIIGLSCMSSELPHAVLAAQRIKAAYPEKTLIFGGAGPTEVAEELITHFPFIDIVVRGEAEETLPELMNALKKGLPLAAVKGIVYRQDGKTVSTAKRELIKDLNALPLPAYDLLRGLKLDKDMPILVNIESSRGCPFDCAFCSTNQFWGRQNRMKDIGRVVEEIRLLNQEYGLRSFMFSEDTFVLNRNRVFDFCQRLTDEKLDIVWSCYGRVDLMDADLIKAMAQSGCFGTFYGIESGSDKILNLTHKGFSVAQAERTVAKALKVFKKVTCSFIFGFPFETMQDFYKTLSLATMFRHMGAVSQLHQLAPFKCSQIYEEHKDTLAFDKNRIPVFTMGTNSERDQRLSPEVIDVIQRYPSVFSAYWYYRHPEFEEKRAKAIEFMGQLYKKD